MSIKGVCANRYLAMKEDGRLLASVSNAVCLSGGVVLPLGSFSAARAPVPVFIKSKPRGHQEYT